MLKSIKCLIVATIALSVLLPGCATLSTPEALIWERALSRSVGMAVKILLPESAPVLNGVCIASGIRDQAGMVSALQQVWTIANDAQAYAVINDLNVLVGATRIMDSDVTESQLSHWQEVLGALCDGSQLGGAF